MLPIAVHADKFRSGRGEESPTLGTRADGPPGSSDR